MMDIIYKIFGEGENINALQMSTRAIVIFIVSIVLIRISGRRSFGMKMPFDNVVIILLGAILARAVTGASPFWPTVAASTILVLLHRLCGRILIRNKRLGKLLTGETKLLYKDGKMMHNNMKDCQMDKEDLMQEARLQTNLNTLDDVEEMYCERNGKVSIVKKNKLQ